MRDWSPIDVLPEILADVPELVFAYTCDGRYLFINDAAAQYLGADPLDVIGRYWNELGHSAEVMESLTARVAVVADTGVAERHRVTGSLSRGGRTFDMSLTPLWSEDGNVLAVLEIAHDITEFVHPPLAS